MHNAETESKFIFDDFSASKLRQLATETLLGLVFPLLFSPAHHNLNNQQLKLFGVIILERFFKPAHHNLNNQQLKQHNIKCPKSIIPAHHNLNNQQLKRN